MLYKTKGIVLKSFAYGDSSMIVKIFTREKGRQSFILPGMRSRKKNKQSALYQGLNILELIAYQKGEDQLNYIKEAKLHTFYNTIPQDIKKTSILFFLNELLYNSLPEEKNTLLFSFMETQLRKLDETGENINDFHLFFLLEYLRFLGIAPNGNHSDSRPFFNIQTGQFESRQSHRQLDGKNSLLIAQMINREQALRFSLAERQTILDILLQFCSLHIPGFREMKSHKILHTILS